MRTLYHWTMDPLSRQVRICLAEKNLKYKAEPVNPWQLDENFLKVCAEGRPPCLIDSGPNGSHIMCGVRAICEYVNETGPRHPLLPDQPAIRAEARRLCHWFEVKFQEEVNAYLLFEKLEKLALKHFGTPEPTQLRLGRQHLAYHLDYVEWLLESRHWLAGNDFSLADIAAGANISSLDYLGEINWSPREKLKDWYQRFKSRPSMRGILQDQMPGLKAHRDYANLDF